MYAVMILSLLLAVAAAIAALYLRRHKGGARSHLAVPDAAPPVVKHKALARIAQRPRNGPGATSP